MPPSTPPLPTPQGTVSPQIVALESAAFGSAAKAAGRGGAWAQLRFLLRCVALVAGEAARALAASVPRWLLAWAPAGLHSRSASA